MSENGITGILLAAGQGTRFGGDKCLAPLPNSVPMAVQAAQNLSAAVDTLLCVIRADDDALRTVLQQHGFATVNCAEAALGMSASLKAGIRAAWDSQGWLIALADMPFIQPETCRRISDVLRHHHGMVLPKYQGKRGHPVGFSRHFRDELLALHGDCGAKVLLQRYPDLVLTLERDDSGICRDIDRPEDLRALNKRYQHYRPKAQIPFPQ